MDKVKVLGIDIDVITMQETLQWIEKAIERGKPTQIITGNPEMLMIAQEDEKFFQTMQSADLVVPDGIGLVLATRYVLKQDIVERVTGFDLSIAFFQLAQQQDYSVYLLGGAPGVAQKAKERLEATYPHLEVRGVHHGYLTEENLAPVLEELQTTRPDLLLVGMGAPRQDLFIANYKDQYQIPVSIGIGGCIDIWAGQKKRAPQWMQNVHLEWFYRFMKEPTRLMRMVNLPRFVYYAAKYKERRLP